MKRLMGLGINGFQSLGFLLRYSPLVKDRMKVWRLEQKRLERKVRTYHLTYAENDVVQECIERIRSI